MFVSLICCLERQRTCGGVGEGGFGGGVSSHLCVRVIKAQPGQSRSILHRRHLETHLHRPAPTCSSSCSSSSASPARPCSSPLLSAPSPPPPAQGSGCRFPPDLSDSPCVITRSCRLLRRSTRGTRSPPAAVLSLSRLSCPGRRPPEGPRGWLWPPGATTCAPPPCCTLPRPRTRCSAARSCPTTPPAEEPSTKVRRSRKKAAR